MQALRIGSRGIVEFTACQNAQFVLQAAPLFAPGFQRLHLGRDQAGRLVQWRRQRLRDTRQRVIIGACPARCPQPAEKLDPHRAAHLVQFAQEQRADFTSGAHVRSSARAAVQALDGDHAQHAGALGSFP